MDFLNAVVEGDLLTTFSNLIEIVICLDVVTMVAYLIGNIGGDSGD